MSGLRLSTEEAQRRGLIDAIATPKKGRDSRQERLQRATAALKQVIPELTILPTGYLLQLPGALLLGGNDLHRLDHRKLNPYRRACHDTVRRAHLLTGLRSGPLPLKRLETGYIHPGPAHDMRGLSTAFKFLEDGLVREGLIPDDGPRFVPEIRTFQDIDPGQRLAWLRLLTSSSP